MGIASVNASDNESTIQATDESSDTVSVSNETLTDTGLNGISSSQTDSLRVTNEDESYRSSDSDVLTAADGTFTDLYNKVKNGGTVTLDRNYVYTASSDSAYVNGITLDKTITINGNGFTVNGNKVARIFNIPASNVVINNIKLINGYRNNNNAAAIYWTGNYGTLNNSIIQDNAGHNNGQTSYGGGAIYVGGSHVTISDCQFNRNNGTGGSGDPTGGSAIYWGGTYGILTRSNFTDNYQKNYDGTVQWRGYHGIISYCNFKGNKNDGSSPEGGAISIYSANNVTTLSCNFEDTYTSSWGILIVWLSPNSQVINCTFKNNDATYGALVSNCNNVNISGCEFTNNQARSGNGAGIYLSGTNNIISDCTFTNNKALVGSGGGIYTIQSTSIIDCTFVGNTAASNGNAIASGNNLNIALVDNDFNGKSIPSSSEGYFGTSTILYSPLYVSLNGSGDGLTSSTPTSWANAYSKIPDYGTIILLPGTYTNIVNQVINKPITIQGSGNVIIDARKTGRIFNITANNVEINGIQFINGYIANSHGGAIHWTGNNGKLSNSIFNDNVAITNNKVNLGGGAVYIGGNNTVVTDCKFVGNNITGNSDPQGGSAIYWGGHNGTLTKSNFTKNHAIGYDGTVQWRGYDGEISYCNFNDNKNDGSSPQGSAISVYWGKNVDIIKCNFTDNYCSSWGTVIIWDSEGSSIYDCNFVGNSNSYGALVTCTPDTKIDGCNFINNTGRGNNAGAIYIDPTYSTGKNTVVNNCIFINNTGGNGGAIYWNSIDGTVLNSTFINNTARSNGGAIYWATTGGKIDSSTFESNTAASGNNLYSTNTVTVSGSVLKDYFTLTKTGNISYGTDEVIGGTFASNAPSSIILYLGTTSYGSISVSSNKFSKTLSLLPVGTYAISFKDANSNTYTFTDNSFTVNRLGTVYISPSGTGSGNSSSSQTTWDKVADIISPTGTVVFANGIYSNFYGKTINQGWTLQAASGATPILDANNNGRIFTVSANNVKINGLTFKNGKVTDSYGSAIHWTGTDGSLSNSVLTENTGRPVTATTTLTMTNNQLKDQITLTKSNIDWAGTETITGTFAHSAPSKVTILFNGASQGSYSVASGKVTASYAFTNPATRSVGSYVVTDLKNIYKKVL